jgi:hypothetical protein
MQTHGVLVAVAHPGGGQVTLTPELESLHRLLVAALQSMMDRLAPFHLLPVAIASKTWCGGCCFGSIFRSSHASGRSFTFVDLMRRSEAVFPHSMEREQRGAPLRRPLTQALHLTSATGFAMSFLSVCSRLAYMREMLQCYGVRTFQASLQDYVRDCRERHTRAMSELLKHALSVLWSWLCADRR